LLILIVSIVCQLLSLALVVRAVLSWILYSGATRNPGIINLYEFLGRLTEPIVKPFRRLLGNYGSTGVDFAPLIALVAIYIVRRLLVWLILLLF
jgi:YggT family protein